MESQRQLRAMLDRIAEKPGIAERADHGRRIAGARARIDESMRYMAVMDRARGRGMLAVLKVFLRHPGVWRGLLRRAPRMLRDRYRRYVSR